MQACLSAFLHRNEPFRIVSVPKPLIQTAPPRGAGPRKHLQRRCFFFRYLEILSGGTQGVQRNGPLPPGAARSFALRRFFPGKRPLRRGWMATVSAKLIKVVT